MPSILCIDDDSDDILLLKRSLRRAGYPGSIHQVFTLEEARDYLSGNERFNDRGTYPLPDLILTDLAFRNGTGIEFLEWFRSQPELARIPVFCVTGSNDPYKRDEALNFGAPCISKTSDFAEVVAVVRDALAV